MEDNQLIIYFPKSFILGAHFLLRMLNIVKGKGGFCGMWKDISMFGFEVDVVDVWTKQTS